MDKEKKIKELTVISNRINFTRKLIGGGWQCYKAYKAISPSRRVRMGWDYFIQPTLDWTGYSKISYLGYACREVASLYADPFAYAVERAVGFSVAAGMDYVTQEVIKKTNNDALIIAVQVGGKIIGECLAEKISDSATTKVKARVEKFKTQRKLKSDKASLPATKVPTEEAKKKPAEAVKSASTTTSAPKSTPIVSASQKPPEVKATPSTISGKAKQVLKDAAGAAKEVAVPLINVGLTKKAASLEKEIIKLNKDIKVEKMKADLARDEKKIAEDFEKTSHEILEKPAASQAEEKNEVIKQREEVNKTGEENNAMLKENDKKLEEKNKKLEEKRAKSAKQKKELQASKDRLVSHKAIDAIKEFISSDKGNKITNRQLHALLEREGFFLDSAAKERSYQNARRLNKVQFRNYVSSYLFSNKDMFFQLLLESASSILLTFLQGLGKSKLNKLKPSVARQGMFGATSSKAAPDSKQLPRFSART